MNLAVGISVLCAVAVTALLVRRELAGPPGAQSRPDIELDEVQWTAAIGYGHRRGPSTAALTLVEFADFECPMCRRYTAEVLAPFLQEAGDRVHFVFRHWPLPYHRFAYPSARAAECAAIQGRFFELHDLLYSKQDSLGLKPYSAFAAEAGVPDMDGFNACNVASGPIPAVDRDAALAKALQARGTPTIIINGTLRGTPPTLDELRAQLD